MLTDDGVVVALCGGQGRTARTSRPQVGPGVEHITRRGLMETVGCVPANVIAVCPRRAWLFPGERWQLCRLAGVEL